MELVHYLAIVRRHLRLIVLATMLAGLGAGVVSLWLPPVYQGSVALLVRPSQPLATVDPGVAAVTTDQISRTYARLMLERPILEKVVADLHLQTNAAQLAGQLKVTPEANTTILDVSAQDTDPTAARDIANTLVNDFIATQKQIQQQETSTPNARSADNLVIVSPAVTPTGPVSPKIPLNVALAALAGLVVSVGFSFLRESADHTVKSDEDLILRVGLFAIGHIWFAEHDERRRGDLLALGSDSASAEAYKTLRTNILFSAVDKKIQTILVTSASAGEGKSRTAANLAIVLAQAGYRTLLVDGDLRRPSQHQLFGGDRDMGFSNLIVADLPDADLIAAVADIPGLWLLPAGPTPPNPSELLGSTRLRARLAGFAQAFTYVIIDSPPLNAVTDASILAAETDATLVVAEYGRSTYSALRHAESSLDTVGANVLGVVINKIPSSSGTYSYYQSGYYPDSNGSRARHGANGGNAQKVASRANIGHD